MNELFLIPAIIISLVILVLGKIKIIGNKIIVFMIMFFILSTLVLFVAYFNATGWDRLGYGIFAFISGVSLISSIITIILQRKMIKLFLIIVGTNLLALILSIAALGTTNSISSKFQAVLSINLIVMLINIIFNYLLKLIRRIRPN